MAKKPTEEVKWNRGILHFIVLCFTVLHRYCVFFFNKLKIYVNAALSNNDSQFLIQVCNIDCHRYTAIAHLIVQTSFYMHWETKKNSYELFYDDIHFIEMVWNQTRNISKVCPY